MSSGTFVCDDLVHQLHWLMLAERLVKNDQFWYAFGSRSNFFFSFPCKAKSNLEWTHGNVRVSETSSRIPNIVAPFAHQPRDVPTVLRVNLDAWLYKGELLAASGRGGLCFKWPSLNCLVAVPKGMWTVWLHKGKLFGRVHSFGMFSNRHVFKWSDRVILRGDSALSCR